jgi:hypothetical protein
MRRINDSYPAPPLPAGIPPGAAAGLCASTALAPSTLITGHIVNK